MNETTIPFVIQGLVKLKAQGPRPKGNCQPFSLQPLAFSQVVTTRVD